MSNNTNYGLGSLQKNSGTNNTGIGAYASYNNLDGYNNTSVGSNSSFFNTTGSNNTSMGAGSMCNNTTGSLNTAVGSSALEGLTGPVGDQNTAIGVQSLYTNQGTQNTAIGAYAALGVTGGNYNTFLGANSSTLNDANYNYSTAIGYNAKIDDSNQIMIGGTGPVGYPNVIIPGNAYLPNFTTATSNDQIVPKSYVDLVAGGLTPTQACVCATTENIDLSLNTAPSSSSTDGFNLSTLTDGNYNILVVNQDGSSNTLTSSDGNGVYILNKNGSFYSWSRPPSNEPMCIGFDATGAFSLVKFGNIYSKQGLVQINNSAIVGSDALRYETVFQLGYELGQGLNATTVGLNVYINVDNSLNFINFLDSTTGVTGASGTLALGTNSTSTVIGPTGGNPIQIQSQIEAQKGITGPTGSFTDLIVSNQIKAPGGITGPTGSFTDLIVSNQIKAPGGITGPTGSFTDLIVSNQIKAPGGITGSTGSFINLTSSNNTYLATSSGSVGIGITSTSFTLDVNGGTRISTTGLGGTTTFRLRDNTSGNEMRFALNCDAGNYNPLVQAGDQVICAAPLNTGEVLTLTSNSSTTTSGVRITTSSVTIGSGGTSSTPTAALSFSGSTVSVTGSTDFSSLPTYTGSTDASGNPSPAPTNNQFITINYADNTYGSILNSNTWTGTNTFQTNTYLATTSGSVGIGTTSPSSTLDVRGNATITSTGLGSSPTFSLIDNTSSNEMRFALNCDAGNYNPLVQLGDQVICATPQDTGEALTLTSNSSTTTSGVRITTSSVTIGSGGASSTPTNAVITDASGVRVRPQLIFPDNTVQTTAFTGGPAGTYTIPNITLDANGRISSISNAYTNGSWQPVIGGQTGTATTYAKRNGKYIVINNLCTVQCEVQVINIGSSLGAMYVSLPFTCDTLVPASFAIGSISGLTSASTNYIDFSLFSQENTNYAVFLYRATVGATSYINLQNTNINASISNPFTIRFTGSYIIA